MDSAKRLEQAVENLETLMQKRGDISPMGGNDSEKLSKLMEENTTLKSKQEEAKERLEVLINSVENGQ